MTDLVTFTDAEFSFRQNGVTYHVRTEVGEGLFSRVVVDQVGEQEQAMEPEES